MSLTVKNVGCMQVADTSGTKNTKAPQATYGEVGTVRVVYQNREYVFGPNQSISFSDDILGINVAAIDSRLRVTDDREGNRWVPNAAPSIAQTRY
jgi:hypothetical protein